jgi:hypothetical protein
MHMEAFIVVVQIGKCMDGECLDRWTYKSLVDGGEA